MVNLSEEIKEYKRGNLDMYRLRKDTKSWYGAVKNSRATEIMPLGAELMHYGKIHTFAYDPGTKDQMPYWDARPTIIMLDVRYTAAGQLVEVGLNINYFPLAIREKIITRVHSLYRGTISDRINARPFNAIQQGKIRMDISRIQTFAKSYGASFGIKQYSPLRRRETSIVSYDEWKRIPFLNRERFAKIDRSGMDNEWQRYIYNNK